MNRPRPLALRAALAALLLACAGCAHVQARDPVDPWEPMNRSIAQFNEGVDAVVLKPAATFYSEKVPAPIRTGVANFFGNLSDVWSFANNVMQLKLQPATESFARVQINTMFGLFGIFDVASDLHIERHRADFGMTLGHWGVPSGPYLVLPLLGPSTLRDTIALPIDRKGDLVSYIDPAGTRLAAQSLRAVQQRSSLLRMSEVLEQAALDKYSFMRDAYLQRRRAEIYAPDDPRREVPPPLPHDPVPAEPVPLR